MTGAELQEKIDKRIWVSLDDTVIIDYINACLMDLAGVLRLETKAQFNLADSSAVALPDNVMEILMVRLAKAGVLDKIPYDDYDLQGYKLFEDKITFQGVLEPPDVMDLYYYRYPQFITSVDDTIDIPKQFEQAIFYYAVGKYQKDDEELDLEKDYLAEYLNMKDLINEYTLKKVT